jgi:hypothetical protein
MMRVVGLRCGDAVESVRGERRTGRSAVILFIRINRGKTGAWGETFHEILAYRDGGWICQFGSLRM